MKTDIILAGVGGQGILSIAAALGSAALNNNLYMKQAETHGMSQRGGDVQSFMRISDKPIFSDLIAKGTADIILSVEPMEALRYLPFLKQGGYVVTNATPFINIPNYPEEATLMATLKALPHQVIIDADSIAKEAAGNVADRIQPRNDVLFFIQNLHLIVDLQAVAGAQQTGAQPYAIEWRLAQL